MIRFASVFLFTFLYSMCMQIAFQVIRVMGESIYIDDVSHTPLVPLRILLPLFHLELCPMIEPAFHFLLLWLPSCSMALLTFADGKGGITARTDVGVCQFADQHKETKQLTHVVIRSQNHQDSKETQTMVSSHKPKVTTTVGTCKGSDYTATVFTSCPFILVLLKAYNSTLCDKNSSCASLTNVSEVP